MTLQLAGGGEVKIGAERWKEPRRMNADAEVRL